MNPETYAEWLRRQGHKVVQTRSSFWHSSALRVFQAFPYHRLIEPSEMELAELFSRHGAVAIRYALPPDCAAGCLSYAIASDGNHYSLEQLGHRTRKNVRRGLRNCTVEPISIERLVEEAWNLRRDTLSRQGRYLKVTEESWRNGYLAAADLPGFQAWGAYVNNRIGAYLVTFRMEDCICVVDQQSHREYLDLNVNNAITFVMTETALAEPGVKSVFYGVESLDAPPSVSEFKFRMGYRAHPIRQRVVFCPHLSAFANQFSYRVLSLLSTWLPADRRLSKAKGMLRIFLAEKNLSAKDRLAGPALAETSNAEISNAEIRNAEIRN
jgi:hypothetical protein